MKFSEILNKIFSSLLIGKWFDTEIYIHWSWWMVLLFTFCFSPITSLLVVLLFGIIVLHELGHFYASKHYGVKINSIVLYMIGGIPQIQKPTMVKEDFLIFSSGLVVNVFLMPILYVISWFAENNFNASYFLLQRLEFLNIFIFLINLIPAFPLDAGQVLKIFLISNFGYSKGVNWTLGISNLLIILVGLYGLTSASFMYVVVALFLYYILQQESQGLRYKKSDDLLESKKTIEELQEKFEEIRDQTS